MGRPPGARRASTGALTALLASALLSACASEEAPKAPGTGGSIPTVGTGGSTGMGGNPSGSDAPNHAADPASDAAPGQADLAAVEPDGTDGAVAMATGGATASGVGGSSIPGSGGVGGTVGGTMDAGERDAPMSGDGGAADGASSDPTLDGAVDTEGPLDDSCNPPPPNGYHAVHFRYPWAGQKTLTLFPKPELMPATIEFKVDALCNSVTCTREQNRPWFNCPVPDAYFVTQAGWLVSDSTRNPAWTTLADRPMPLVAGDYWLRWAYGRPEVPQWPEYAGAATDWLVRMECEVNTKYGDGWNYPTRGESWDKTCQSGAACDYAPGTTSQLSNDYHPPGYFRVFGDFLAKQLGGGAKAANGQTHHDFWYKTAETVYELVERCYDQKGVHPGLIGNGGDILHPCSDVGGGQPYQWGRALWRIAVDAAWFGNDTRLPENAPGSSKRYVGKSRMQAKLDNIQGFYADFHQNNPPEPGANRFSSLCHDLAPDGAVTSCDTTRGHNSYTVNMAMCPFATRFDNGGATTSAIRREALEEALTATVTSEHYFEESLGVYSILFLTGSFPNPMTVPAQ